MKINSNKQIELYLNKTIKGLYAFMLSFFPIVIITYLNIDNTIVSLLKIVPFLTSFYSIWFSYKYIYSFYFKNKSSNHN